MVRYATEPDCDPSRAAKSRGSHLRIHYKHCREITHMIRGMKVNKAMKYLENVLAFKDIVPFVRHTGGIGRKAMAKIHKSPGDKGRWPVKATAVIKDLLANAMSNAEIKGLDLENMVIGHVQCNRAPPGRRRTYRAHGRIGKYASEPAHIEFILTEKKEAIKKADEEPAQKQRITKRMSAILRSKPKVKVGGASA